MNQTELIGRICGRPSNYGWFLGAGASRTAGLPTAVDVTWDLKRRYYCLEENQEIVRQDLQNYAVKERIQSFLDSRGFPPLWADDEYTIYFERIFGEDKERQRKYINAILSEERVSLSVGNRVFGALMAASLCRVAFTTNFDTVVEKAVAEIGQQSLSAFHLEGAHAANAALNNEEYPLYCKLHGDFRYDSLKNLSQDLKQQNVDLSNCLVNAGNRFGFIVTGYSGRDESVMRLFQRVMESPNPFPHGLYWTVMKGAAVHPSVSELIERASEKGIDAHIVETQTFDVFMLRLWRNIDGKPAKIDAKVRKSRISTVDIPLPPPGRRGPLLRLTGLPILSLPERCHSLTFSAPKDWQDLRQAMADSQGRLILTKADTAWGWGTKDRIRETFDGDLASITVQDVPNNIRAVDNFHLKGFFERALATSLARGRPLLARSRKFAAFLIANPHATSLDDLAPLSDLLNYTSGDVGGLFTTPTTEHPNAEQVRWAEALRLSVNERNGQLWLLVHPDIWIWPPRARKDARDFMDARRRNRHNRKYNELLDAWLGVALGPHRRASEIQVSPFGTGDAIENPQFRLGSRTAFSRRL